MRTNAARLTLVLREVCSLLPKDGYSMLYRTDLCIIFAGRLPDSNAQMLR